MHFVAIDVSGDRQEVVSGSEHVLLAPYTFLVAADVEPIALVPLLNDRDGTSYRDLSSAFAGLAECGDARGSIACGRFSV